MILKKKNKKVMGRFVSMDIKLTVVNEGSRMCVHVLLLVDGVGARGRGHGVLPRPVVLARDA